VLVRDGAIVAHAAALPLRYVGPRGAVTLLHPFDWMSEPSAIGSGAALLARLSKLADGLLIVGGSETTQRMVRPLGFRALGEVQRYAAERAPAQPGYSAEALSPAELSAAVTSSPGWLAVEPRAPWLSACLACPATPMTLASIRSGARVLGEVAFAFAPGQARIAGFWPSRAEPSTRAELLAAARQVGSQRPGVDEVVCMANAPHDRRALEEVGFMSVGSVPLFVLASGISADAQLSFQMIDGDLAFLHDGRPRPWLAELDRRPAAQSRPPVSGTS
jgi:hypothetical protein